MIQIESQLEQQFIKKLQELNYTYRSDIRTLDALEKNFREKFERLNFVTLSDDEFRKLLQENVTPDVATTAPPSTTVWLICATGARMNTRW